VILNLAKEYLSLWLNTHSESRPDSIRLQQKMDRHRRLLGRWFDGTQF